MSTPTPKQPGDKSLVTTKPSALKMLAARMSVEPEKLYDSLRATVFQKATNEELLALTVVANEYDLNPFLKEIYAFPAKGGGITPIVSVDGWNKMLLRQPSFDGIEFSITEKEDGSGPYSCTATIYVKGRSRPSVTTKYLDECFRNTDNWKNMPRRMLRNRTLCQGSRMAFGFSGIYHEDEAIDIIATVSSDMPGASPAAPAKALPTTPPPTKVEGEKTAQQELESFVTTNGYTFGQMIKWGGDSGIIADASSIPSFSEVPTDVCRRLLRAPTGFLSGLASLPGPKAAQ